MAFVCKWLGVYLCMRESPATTPAVMDQYNVVIVSKEMDTTMEKSGGMAFEVLIKPATADSPRVVKNGTPTDRRISLELIDKKLKDAEDRRQSMEAVKLTMVNRDNERRQEVSERAQKQLDLFAREAERKLAEKMELMAENKEANIRALQHRLHQHAARVEEVRRAGDEYRTKLKERVERKQEQADEKREARLGNLQDRIRKHQKHVDEVIEASRRFTRDTEEKMIEKMETSLRQREQQLDRLMERLQKHELHGKQVRQNKLNQSASSCSIDDSLSNSTSASSETDMCFGDY